MGSESKFRPHSFMEKMCDVFLDKSLNITLLLLEADDTRDDLVGIFRVLVTVLQIHVSNCHECVFKRIDPDMEISDVEVHKNPFVYAK